MRGASSMAADRRAGSWGRTAGHALEHVLKISKRPDIVELGGNERADGCPAVGAPVESSKQVFLRPSVTEWIAGSTVLVSRRGHHGGSSRALLSAWPFGRGYRDRPRPVGLFRSRAGHRGRRPRAGRSLDIRRPARCRRTRPSERRGAKQLGVS